MSSLLKEAYEQIAIYFPGSRAELGIDIDPETGDKKLLLTITANLEPDEAFEMLQDFDDNWWLRNLDRAQGCLSIHLELV